MMLDDLHVLRAAGEAYRAAATEAGLTWPDRTHVAWARSDIVYRLFDVGHIPEQLIWLTTQGWDLQRLLPEGGWLLPWPTDINESLRYLHFSIATPFPWRHQFPLFSFDDIMYTFVLTGDHEGEIWRYEYDPDAWASVRAAIGLAALFTEWTKGIAAGVVFYADRDTCLHVGDDVRDPFDVLLQQAPDLDPFAFPVPISNETLLRTRQRECNVDMDCINRGPDCHEELLDVIDATRESLHM